MSEVSRAEVCALAVAHCFAEDGEIMVSPMGTVPSLGARLAKATFAPDLLLTDGFNKGIKDVLPLGEAPSDELVEAWIPFEQVFDIVWWGKRHVMMGATQIDQFGNQNIACIGPWDKPKVQLLGVRGAPGNTINHVTSYWVPNHNPRVFVDKVDVVSGIGYDRAAQLDDQSRQFHEIRAVITNLGVFDFKTDDGRMRIASIHPGVELDHVREQTGFELVVPDAVPTTVEPSAEQCQLIARLDPNQKAIKEVAV